MLTQGEIVVRGLVRPGMEIVGGDGQTVGTIESLTDDRFVVMHVPGGLRFPVSAIERIEGERVYFGNPAAMYLGQTGPQSEQARRDERLFEKRAA